MTVETNPTPEIIPPAPKRRGWKTPVLVTGAFFLGLGGAVATSAVSQGTPFGPGPAGPLGSAIRNAVQPMVVDTMIDHGIRHLAIEIEATPDQQAKLITIAQSAAKDLLPLRDQVEAAREKAHSLLLQPNLDRTAIEAFRADQMALADQVSRRVAQAVADANDVLTPEQRVKIANFRPTANDRGPRFGRPGGDGYDGYWYRG